MIDTDKVNYLEYEGCIADMKGYDLAVLAEELLAEVRRLREALDWVRREETRKEADYIWEGVEEILAGDPRWKGDD